MHGSFVIVEYMWNPFCTTFCFSQAVGEDMVNTGWRDSDFCVAMHEILHVHSRTGFTCSMWHSSIANVGASLSLLSHS